MKYVLIIVSSLTILLLFGGLRQYLRIKTYQKIANECFGSLSKIPSLNVSGSYGYPSFEVLFSTKQDLEMARESNLLKSFSTQIENLIKEHIPDFNSEMGITFKVGRT